jgi:hypothetical protein
MRPRLEYIALLIFVIIFLGVAVLGPKYTTIYYENLPYSPFLQIDLYNYKIEKLEEYEHTA